MLTARRINKLIKGFLEREGELDQILPERVLFYRLIAPPQKKRDLANFVPFHWPKKNNYKICNLANRVHVYMLNEFPESEKHKEAFSHMVGANGQGPARDLYLVLEEMNHKHMTMCYNMLQFRPIKYLKL